MGDTVSVSCPHVVYLGGFGRSGSTLLERILGAVPGWVNVGELVDLPRSVYPHRELCGCGERFTDCPFWSRVGQDAFGGWSDETLARLAGLRLDVARQRQVPQLLRLARGGAPGSELARRVAAYQEGYGRIYRAVARAAGATVVVDASKGPAHGLALGLSLPHGPGKGYTLGMVNLVRDPRGVAYSWSRRQVERPQSGTDPRPMWSISASRSAAQWAALQTEMALIGSVAGVPTRRLRYEDLVARPRRAVLELVHGLGLPLPDGGLDHVGEHAVTLAASHGLSGNPSRFRHGRIELSADVEWQRAMPARDRRVVTTATLPWLMAYGYPPARPRGTEPHTSSRAERG
ncbi:MAG TPA: sulfotransferase [Nocardioides sp.]|uniref:sulfotransferase n=1 Tax=Nocardioides sp. TaxID=35761 RepID=UPI002CA6B9E0|nr:sulfotransferase [Nocardioides sp.]HQR26671.1 sulfotransferase [Nocardioides sp.]